MTFKDCLEIVYYIFFIILTGLIVFYAYKTYALESKKETELLFKLTADEKEIAKPTFEILLQVHNCGNMPVSKINIEINQFHFISVDFLSPGESFYFPIATASRNAAHGLLLESDFLRQTGYDNLILTAESEKPNKKYRDTLNAELLKTSYTGSSDYLHEVARELSDINKTLSKKDSITSKRS